MDCLRLEGLEVRCIIGDLPDEREREQVLRIDAALRMDLRKAGATDDLRDTADYAALAARIRARLAAAKCRLIERAAELAAEECLACAGVAKAEVRVRKSGAVEGLACAAAEVERP